MPLVHEVTKKVCDHFEEIRPLMNKYPNAFQLHYDNEKGYWFLIDLDLIKIPPEEEHLNLE